MGFQHPYAESQSRLGMANTTAVPTQQPFSAMSIHQQQRQHVLNVMSTDVLMTVRGRGRRGRDRSHSTRGGHSRGGFSTRGGLHSVLVQVQGEQQTQGVETGESERVVEELNMRPEEKGEEEKLPEEDLMDHGIVDLDEKLSGSQNLNTQDVEQKETKDERGYSRRRRKRVCKGNCNCCAICNFCGKKTKGRHKYCTSIGLKKKRRERAKIKRQKISMDGRGKKQIVGWAAFLKLFIDKKRKEEKKADDHQRANEVWSEKFKGYMKMAATEWSSKGEEEKKSYKVWSTTGSTREVDTIKKAYSFDTKPFEIDYVYECIGNIDKNAAALYEMGVRTLTYYNGRNGEINSIGGPSHFIEDEKVLEIMSKVESVMRFYKPNDEGNERLSLPLDMNDFSRRRKYWMLKRAKEYLERSIGQSPVPWHQLISGEKRIINWPLRFYPTCWSKINVGNLEKILHTRNLKMDTPDYNNYKKFFNIIHRVALAPRGITNNVCPKIRRLSDELRTFLADFHPDQLSSNSQILPEPSQST
ncbi:hypothetical protein AAMO2058_000123500 [Amorphochlora amoebiformis]